MTTPNLFPSASTFDRFHGAKVCADKRSPSGHVALVQFGSALRAARVFAKSFAVTYRMSVAIRRAPSGWLVALPVTDDF